MKRITLAVVVLFMTLFGYDYATGQIPQVYSVGPSGQSGYDYSSIQTADSGEGQYAVLEGFTITNGYASRGGGINIQGAYDDITSPTIEDCTIIDNEAVYNGGGIALTWSNTCIINCTIKDNSCTEWGGGIYFGGDGTSLTVDGCIIRDNSATSSCCSAGGGVMLNNGGGEFEDCRIYSNWANQGAGMYVAPQDGGKALYIEDCDIYQNGDIDTLAGGGIYIKGHVYVNGDCYAHFYIDSNKIYDNRANYGAGVYFDSISNDAELSDFINNFIYENVAEADAPSSGYGGAFYSEACDDFHAFNNTCADNEADYGGGCCVDLDSEITFVNAIFWDTEANEEMYGAGDIYATYSDIYMTSGTYPGTGNINDDPLFTSPGLDRYTIGDEDSKCIDGGDDPTGVPDHDFEGDSRPYNYIYDMGADEYVP